MVSIATHSAAVALKASLDSTEIEHLLAQGLISAEVARECRRITKSSAQKKNLALMSRWPLEDPVDAFFFAGKQLIDDLVLPAKIFGIADQDNLLQTFIGKITGLLQPILSVLSGTGETKSLWGVSYIPTTTDTYGNTTRGEMTDTIKGGEADDYELSKTFVSDPKTMKKFIDSKGGAFGVDGWAT